MLITVFSLVNYIQGFRFKLSNIDKIVVFFFLYILFTSIWNTVEINFFNSNVNNYYILNKSILFLRYLFLYFTMRLLVENKLKGLTSLDKINKFENKNLLRPLLDLKKTDLIFVSKQVFDFYISDPSNKDEKYHRIRIRKLIEDLQKSGLDKKNFLKTIKNLKYSKTIVDFYVNENLRKNRLELLNMLCKTFQNFINFQLLKTNNE